MWIGVIDPVLLRGEFGRRDKKEVVVVVRKHRGKGSRDCPETDHGYFTSVQFMMATGLMNEYILIPRFTRPPLYSTS